MNEYCTITLLSPPYSLLTYTLPPWLPYTLWKPGLRVAILLGKEMLRTGIILSLTDQKPELPHNVVLRPILWSLEKNPIFSYEYIQMIQELALRQSIPSGKIFASILPMGLRTTHVQMKCTYKNVLTSLRLKELKHKTEEELHDIGTRWISEENNDWLTSQTESTTVSEKCILTVDPPWPIRPSATRQRVILDFLFTNGVVSKKELLQKLGKEYRTTLTSLVRYGLISIKQEILTDKDELTSTIALLPPLIPLGYTLTEEQKEVVALLKKELQKNQAKTFLLFGITGSGKTAIYLEVIQECIRNNQSVLVLAPEVALALKLQHEIKTVFPIIPCYLSHGYQSSQQKEDLFRKIVNNQVAKVIIGTRSALFLPLTNIGSIILDEEHDASFKQDERLIYHAKEIAWFRAIQSNALLLLGSATPDIKTFHAVENNKISIVKLHSRVGGGALPTIKLIDSQKLELKDVTFANESLTILKETLEVGEQAVILLNRRGYAPIMYCITCRKSIRCPSCDVGMSYHKIQECLICHYCGKSIEFPCLCPSCKGTQFLPMGKGTEKVEEEIRTILPPDSMVLRLDYDTTRRPGRTEEILKAFAQGKSQVLIGTQMLSKGHHFPNVTLVIVVNADIGLNIPDYRAAEKTFQLLTQSAGRAGRGEKAGQVLIQTHDTSHYCWKFIQQHDYLGFYKYEIALRQKWLYPPFINLALIRLSYPIEWKEGKIWIKKVQSLLQEWANKLNVSVRGPALSPIPILRGRNRFQCLLKSNNWQHIRTIFYKIQTTALPQKLRVVLDIDPIDML
ncbi:primosomal protein N' [Lawsonia intracellularis]|uniref:replication restart helicase PriA n=1 Tax=Lawsonia intracellularis TaxID=29546 RepID=UPI0009760B30|nr:primosomal protein N' [Lawsonia intracellularis]OMQ05933.1 primosomal protein N' [Lawsonia intracellularis]